MVMKVNNEVDTDGKDENRKMPQLKDVDDVCVEYLVEEETLVMRISLNIHVNVDNLKDQRENIFHTRCHVQNKICNLIINDGSYTNIANTELVEKLNFHTTKYFIPYKLQWLNDTGEVKVNKQVLVVFSIGKYYDEVLYDIVPMQVIHLFLGRL
jgi:hypothetical protein